ncbi:hypothetical protein HJB93_28775 [Rhizobium sp. NLR12b]|uniref:hypothetical protein n=1 Tax=Rhizobium sp. NLR12b TaxID=2731108 RepID=UPI001C82BABE|nr:hypothetical protein [Rhizobium sp. NLR12b]MBX5303180.1 hypothetical protein [Rhizobium sp. NLR12b]
MTSSQQSYKVVEDDDFDVLIIHGVGNPAIGDLTRLVTETLRRTLPDRMATIRVSECNWNKIVEPSARNGAILFTALVDLSTSLARASAIGDGLLVDNRIARQLRVLSAFALMFAEIGIAAALAGFVLLVLLGLSLASANNVGLFPDAVPAGVSFIRWSMLAAAGALPLLIVSGLARTLILRASAPFFVELRRALLLVFRPLLILAFSFFFIPWRRVAGEEWVSLSLFTALAMVPATIFLGLFALWLDPSFKWSELGTATLNGYGFIVGLSVAVFAIAFVTVRMIAPSLKVLLDIFRYIGSDGYREAIQLHMNALLRKRFAISGPERPIYILSHSLGTVIALDSLLLSGEWDGDAQVTLITLGSPIRRFFMRFFPGLFFPASVTKAATAVSARMSFRWINCYRPLDQVGTALGLNGLAYCRDVSTNQWKRILDAHPDYWGDDCVALAITKAIVATPMNSVDVGLRDRFAPQQYIVADGLDALEKFRQQVFAAICRVIAVAFLVAPLIVGATVVWANYSTSLTEAAKAHVIQATGIDTLATVTHWRQKIPRGGDYFDHFYLTYKSSNGEDRTAPISYHSFGTLQTIDYQVNVEALVDHVRSHCSDVDPRPVRRIEPQYYRKCRREDIRLRYDPNAPDHFIFPDFPPNRSWWDAMRDCVFSFFFILPSLFFVGVLTLVIVFPLGAMILGLNVFKKL